MLDLSALSPSKQKAPRAIFMIGAPGSGKSTWRDNYLSSDHARVTTVISSDDKVEAIAATNGKTYSEVFSELDRDQMERECLSDLRRALARREDVIIDRTNMTVAGRRRFLSQISNVRYCLVGTVFQVPEDVLFARVHARAEATGKVIPMVVMKDMLASYQAPSAAEFDYIQVVQ